MSKSIITVMRCDRCGFEAQAEEHDSWVGWAKAFAAEVPEPDQMRAREVGAPGREAADLCPGCSGGLFSWYNEVREVAQPRPSEPVYTSDHRNRAIAMVVPLVMARIDAAIDVVREQPTVILSGEAIPGTYVDLDSAAAEIIDGFAKILCLKRGVRRHPR